MNELLVRQLLYQLIRNNSSFILPIVFCQTGSRQFRYNLETSDHDFDALWTPNNYSVAELLDMLSLSAKSYLGIVGLTPAQLFEFVEQDKGQFTEHLIREHLSATKTFDGATEGKPQTIDLALHSSHSILDQLIGKSPSTAREQMFFLSLLNEENSIVAPDQDKIRQLLDFLFDTLRSSDAFLASLFMYWDRWWQLIVKPHSPLKNTTLDSISDFDFSSRTEMFERLQLPPLELEGQLYDTKRSAMMLAVVQSWNSLLESEPNKKRWAESSIDWDFVREVRAGSVPYPVFAGHRNRALERLRANTCMRSNPSSKIQIVKDYFEIIESLPFLKI